MNRLFEIFLCLLAPPAIADSSSLPEITCHTQEIEGVHIFYREAGPQGAPVLLLLRGFPSSSFYYRNLIPMLAGKYHLVAPDYPGFGHSDTPEVDKFVYTFDHLAEVIGKFVEAKGIAHCVIYMQDYGAPVGMRVAVQHPDWIDGLVFQNANVYQEGLLERFFLKKPLWDKRTGATEAPVLRNMQFDSVKFQYVHGTRHPETTQPRCSDHGFCLDATAGKSGDPTGIAGGLRRQSAQICGMASLAPEVSTAHTGGLVQERPYFWPERRGSTPTRSPGC